MRRLYFRIYLTVLGVGLLAVVAVGYGVHLLMRAPSDVSEPVRRIAEYVASDLPRDPVEAERVLADRGTRLMIHMTLWDEERTLVAAHGPVLEAPTEDTPAGKFLHTDTGPGVLLRLEDGRWIAAAPQQSTKGEGLGKLLRVLLLISLGVAVGCFPIARRLTRRLEGLTKGVEELGGGDLSARVDVEGDDEIARLAEAFNASAARIESLVTAQKRVLASASHELRSPLARMRMGLALLEEAGDDRPAAIAALKRDIAELDGLVEDVLLASRLEAGRAPAERDRVDLLGLLAEEGAKVGAEVGGEPTTVLAHPAMIRRLLRNLYENAQRYGAPPIVARVASTGSDAIIVVTDGGAGVPESERERIFEPFYRPGGHRESADGGVGLGLAMVREIARAHGGSVACVSSPEGGTRFEVRLPA